MAGIALPLTYADMLSWGEHRNDDGSGASGYVMCTGGAAPAAGMPEWSASHHGARPGLPSQNGAHVITYIYNIVQRSGHSLQTTSGEPGFSVSDMLGNDNAPPSFCHAHADMLRVGRPRLCQSLQPGIINFGSAG